MVVFRCMEGLIEQQFINIGDRIHFVFKGFQIYGKVMHGGHIGGTQIVRPDQSQVNTLYSRVYPSLTSWSEACLREGLNEENMRYASWKRVVHVASQRTLQSLRSEYNVNAKSAHASRQDLFAEINRLHLKVKQMTRTPTPLPSSATVHQTDQLLVDSDAIEFFREWSGTCLARSCLPQTGGMSD